MPDTNENQSRRIRHYGGRTIDMTEAEYGAIMSDPIRRAYSADLSIPADPSIRVTVESVTPDPDTDTTTIRLRWGTPAAPESVVEDLITWTLDNHFRESVVKVDSVRNHPFEGPEVFDDSVKLEDYTGYRADEPVFADEAGTELGKLNSPWPLIDEAIRDLRNNSATNRLRDVD